MKDRIEPSDADTPGSSDVYRLQVGDRELILVGTAHVSSESVDLVRHVIETEKPDCVCVELDSQRYAALTQESHWEALDLRGIIRSKQLATLLINILLMSFQRRIGGKLGVIPGSELVEAIKASEEYGIPVALCDRNIRVTLRRAWHALTWHRKLLLLASVVRSAFETPELDEAELRRIRQRDVMTELMAELAAEFPALKRVLIDERDAYLAQRIRESAGRKVVAVVGAGHVAGMSDALEAATDIALDGMEEMPLVSPAWKILGWSIPVVIVALLIAIGVTKGFAAAGDSMRFWVLVNSIPTAVGATLAIAHPLTILAAFVVAPFTSLTPLVGVSYVAAFTQAWLCPPRVHEFQSVSDDIVIFSRWWSSRLLRVFLVFILTAVFGAIGTWIGGLEIVSKLVA